MHYLRLIVSSCLVVGLALGLAACFKVERRTTDGNILPAAMLGSWRGDWSSSTGPGAGSVTLSLQMFESQPVVQVDAVHPCLVSGNYEAVIAASHMELLRNGVTVFAADIDLATRQITGTYACPEDAGTWNAHWDHELPPLGNISGLWEGQFHSDGGLTEAFTMEVQQRWQLGLLQLTGEVVVSGLGVGFPITNGLIDFRVDGFDIALRANQAGVSMLVQGSGVLTPTSRCDGVLLVEGPSGPLVAGTWVADRVQ